MVSLLVLLLLAPPLLLLVMWKTIFRLDEPRTNNNNLDSSRPAKPQQQETSGTLTPVSSIMITTPRPSATSLEIILQFVLDALHHLTSLPLLMVNQPDHNLPCLTRASMVDTEQMRADQKNAALLASPAKSKYDFHAASWSDSEAPEEEMSDLSDEEDQAESVAINTAQNQLLDGMQFYLAVSQVRKRTVQSVLALGMAKTLTTLRERTQNESIAVIEQKYPDFTCLPSKSVAAQQAPEGKQRPLGLLAAMRLPSAAAVAESYSTPRKTHCSIADAEGRIRRPSLPSREYNISRVA